MSPIERNETYTKWEQDAITMLLLHLCALLICLYLGEMGYAEDTAPVIFVLAVFLTGFLPMATCGACSARCFRSLWSITFYRALFQAELFRPRLSHHLCNAVCGGYPHQRHDSTQP